MSTPIDLSQLPAPNIIEPLNFETILADRKARLIELTPAEERDAMAELLALESEPLVKLLEENAYRELLLRQRINEAARAVMLAYAGGSDLEQIGANYSVQKLEGESDANYRRRIQLSPEGYSTAGPAEGYRFHALGADPNIKDASITSPAPGDVMITVLARSGNGTAGPTLLASVLNTVGAEDVRPLTDRVSVQSATVVAYTVEAQLTIDEGPDAGVVQDAAVDETERLVAERHALGRDVPLSALYAALHRPGVQAVELLRPTADIHCDKQQAPFCTGISVTVTRGDS